MHYLFARAIHSDKGPELKMSIFDSLYKGQFTFVIESVERYNQICVFHFRN